MISRYLKQIFSNELNKFFKILNLVILLPIILFPLVLFGSVFAFDNPKSIGLTFILFFVVIAYPFYLLVIAYYNVILYKKNKILGFILPTLIVLLILYGIVSLVIWQRNDIQEKITKENKRTEQGFIGEKDDFKIIDNKVYYYDTLIIGANAKTFKIIRWDWQCDTNSYYRFGKRIPEIDRKTFEFINHRYSKDKNFVYFDGKLIEGANPQTFYCEEGTNKAFDGKNCFLSGKKFDCERIKQY